MNGIKNKFKIKKVNKSLINEEKYIKKDEF
jgi:hypothetical protein